MDVTWMTPTHQIRRRQIFNNSIRALQDARQQDARQHATPMVMIVGISRRPAHFILVATPVVTVTV